MLGIDRLERASRVVARQIEGDWPQLYPALPFYPPRGNVEQDGDIDKTVQKHYRVEDKFKVRITLQHQAMAHVLSDPCSALWLERL